VAEEVPLVLRSGAYSAPFCHVPQMYKIRVSCLYISMENLGQAKIRSSLLQVSMFAVSTQN
jgi:hypothetical protein